MAVKSTGPLSIQEVATEFGDTAPHSISEFYRGGSIVPDAASNSSIPTSGQINIGGFYGAQNRVSLDITISSNTANYNLYTIASANPGYQAGITDINLTVDSGVIVSSSSTSTYALSVPSDFDSGDNINLINNGTIVGRGGNGGTGGGMHPATNYATAGGAGGHALYINRPVTITNGSGTLAGAGGGGGGSGAAIIKTGTWPKGGGQINDSFSGNGGGGGAGTPAGSGGPSVQVNSNNTGKAGSAGTATAGGAGGARTSSAYGYTGAGGAGGARGAAGATAEPYSGTTTNPRYPSQPGGAAGRYITGNPYATWVSNGTRLGGSS